MRHEKMMNKKIIAIMMCLVFIFSAVCINTSANEIETCNDEKSFKNIEKSTLLESKNIFPTLIPGTSMRAIAEIITLSFQTQTVLFQLCGHNQKASLLRARIREAYTRINSRSRIM